MDVLCAAPATGAAWTRYMQQIAIIDPLRYIGHNEGLAFLFMEGREDANYSAGDAARQDRVLIAGPMQAVERDDQIEPGREGETCTPIPSMTWLTKTPSIFSGGSPSEAARSRAAMPPSGTSTARVYGSPRSVRSGRRLPKMRTVTVP